MRLFVSLNRKCDGYQTQYVTPYMHIMTFHMPDVIRKHKSLYRFSCQGMHVRIMKLDLISCLYCLTGTEKKNDEAKKTFFRSSNKWDAAKDILTNDYKVNVMSCFKRKRRRYR